MDNIFFTLVLTVFGQSLLKTAMSPPAPIGSNELLLPDATDSENMTCSFSNLAKKALQNLIGPFDWDRYKICPITIQLPFKKKLSTGSLNQTIQGTFHTPT